MREQRDYHCVICECINKIDEHGEGRLEHGMV